MRIPIAGDLTNRASTAIKDQHYINAFVDIAQNKATGDQTTSVIKRDGMVYNTQPSGTTGEGRGIFSWNSKLYSVIGNVLYSDTTAIKTLATSTGAVGFTDWSAANDYLILLDGTDGYYISTTDVVTEITDAQFPTPHLPFPVYMDQYLFVQKTTGEIFNCDSGDVTAWASTSYLTPESYPDGAVAICRQNNLLVSLGVNSVEYFYDAANAAPGSPLGRNQQAILQYGCASGQSVAQQEGLVLFVAASKTGEYFVVALEGTSDTNISTEAINRILQAEGSSIGDCWAYMTRQKGHLLYVLNLPSQNRTLVYDLQTKLWHEWSWYDGTSDSLFPMIGSTEHNYKSYFLHQANGKTYYNSPTTYQDDSRVLKVTIQTGRFDGDSGNVKFLDRLELISDYQTNASSMSVYWSDDDYKTWSSARTLDLQSRAYLYRCGSFRRRAFKLYSEANTPLRLFSIELILRMGVH